MNIQTKTNQRVSKRLKERINGETAEQWYEKSWLAENKDKTFSQLIKKYAD